MEECPEVQDWEMLPSSDDAVLYAPNSGNEFRALGGTSGNGEDGGIDSDYVALGSDEGRATRRVSSGDESEEGDIDSDNPSWVDPDSDPRHLERRPRELRSGRNGFPMKSSVSFWSDESSDGQSSTADNEKRELGSLGDSIVDVGLGGIEAGNQNSGDDEGRKDLGFGGIGRNEGTETGDEKHDESSELARRWNEGFENKNRGEGAKGMVWWKMPLEFLKFCAFRVRKPIWSISVGAALLGFVMLARRVYKMKHKSQSIPPKIFIDDKMASKFVVHSAHLNEAFSVVKRVHIIRTFLPTGGVTSWSTLPLR